MTKKEKCYKCKKNLTKKEIKKFRSEYPFKHCKECASPEVVWGDGYSVKLTRQGVKDEGL